MTPPAGDEGYKFSGGEATKSNGQSSGTFTSLYCMLEPGFVLSSPLHFETSVGETKTAQKSFWIRKY